MDKVKIGISHGDINGISYEVIIKTLSDTRLLDFCIPVIYGSPKVLAYYRKAFNKNTPSPVLVNSIKDVKQKKVHIINCITDSVKVEIGKSTKEAGEYALAALQKAVQDLKYGELDALVTAPINKKNIQSSDFSFPGHTEYLAKEFNSEDHLMFMVSDDIKVAVATAHIPLKDVAETISIDNILKKLKILNESLKNDFGVSKPKIAVLGLNPHCGDEGVLGKEEQEIIIPAIEQARKENIVAVGPYPTDGYFGSLEYKKFDATLAMYHDQGLTSFKVFAFEEGINYTAGLTTIRTSPAHGTAYEIAGKGVASEVSFRNAMYKAVDIYNNRKNQAELVKNQLNTNDSNSNDYDTDRNDDNQIDE